MLEQEIDTPTDHQKLVIMEEQNPNQSHPMFSLTTKELTKANEWITSHDKEKHIVKGKKFRYAGAIGGAYTWCFTPTTIGVATTVQCSCGEKINITDYDLW